LKSGSGLTKQAGVSKRPGLSKPPPFRYDVIPLVKAGENVFAIEAAAEVPGA
jgi:hypothetical protein